MPTVYPAAKDNFANPNGGDVLAAGPHSLHHANAYDAIEAIENELGINPRGAYADVAARLTALASGGGVAKIADTIAGSDAPTLPFSSIPATDRSLMLTWRGRASAGPVDFFCRINGDTVGANYYSQHFSAAGATLTGAEVLGTAGAIKIGTLLDPTHKVSSGYIIIPDYARTNWEKSLHANAGYSANNSSGSQLLQMFWGEWRSTAIINSLILLTSAGNIKAGTVATLYGLST